MNVTPLDRADRSGPAFGLAGVPVMNNVNATGRRVLVVGLGISGTATALRLRQIGWDPVVVEKAPARRTGGQYIVMFGAGQAAARRLGILDRMTDRNVADGSAFSVD